jgi:hypothetical protein
MNRAQVRVDIVRYTEDYPPGIVEYRLRDADGRELLRETKQVNVTSEDLSWDSKYPRPGQLDCDVVEQYDGKVRIVTDDDDECVVPEASMIWPEPDSSARPAASP